MNTSKRLFDFVAKFMPKGFFAAGGRIFTTNADTAKGKPLSRQARRQKQRLEKKGRKV